MTIAAQQCREYIERVWPETRISRKSCRDTAGGSISQHSAYTVTYDSNALDIMGIEGGTWDENVAHIQTVVDSLERQRFEFSIRIILWQTTDHYGHAHVDFWPTILIHKWCSTPEKIPTWGLSDGTLIRNRNPLPENGLYQGDDMSFAMWVAGWVEGLAEDPIGTWNRLARLFDEGNLVVPPNTDPASLPTTNGSQTAYWWLKLPNPNDPEWPGFYARRELEYWAANV